MLATIQEELPRFVAPLAHLANTEASLVRIPLAVTGKWVRGANELSITRGDLEAINRNFQERLNGEINVDYDHASEMPEVAAGGPVPSAGRIVRLDPPEPMNGNRESGVGSRGRADSLLPTPYSRFYFLLRHHNSKLTNAQSCFCRSRTPSKCSPTNRSTLLVLK